MEKELLWLKDCHSQVLQQSLKDLESAFKNFFQKRADFIRKLNTSLAHPSGCRQSRHLKRNAFFPKFKKKGVKESFRFPQGCKIQPQNDRLYLPKIGWVRYRNSREIVGEVKNVTVSMKCGRFFVSIQTEFEQEIPTHKGGEIGIDMGIARFATLSNGEFFEPLNAFKTYKGKLAKLQKQLKNKVKFSKNWQKLKAKISNNHAMIYVEDLIVSNMSASAKGTVEARGKNVKQKSGLNRSILDQSWFEFRRQLDYKTQWLGGFLVAVPPQNTSRTCPCCGHTAKENRETQAHFECVECGYTENADVVGAINVLARGQRLVSLSNYVQA